ncbi:U-box domain-containing protein 4-like [Impatiens glandulifera]|uniref:U-box domain-containing protein 4-like n=1 Tax=Impatiens glandulifera TaxID=253017 RepID=UPI001FB055F4|nr:U-box domain-containing protein 4-like [Impatiens glandulifera]XP_047320139.1 U-box domain-containing protein 4-like [Impatiens glandulifera]
MAKALLHVFTSFFQLSSCDSIIHGPAQKSYKNIEEILRLMKPTLDAIVNSSMANWETMQEAFVELRQCVDELAELFGNWHPLMSKIYLVLQVESLTFKVCNTGLEILDLLKSSKHPPAEQIASSLELSMQKIKQMDLHQTTAIINEAVRERRDGFGCMSECQKKCADSLNLKSNQDLLIEAVALEKLKENSEQADNTCDADYIDQLISVVGHMQEHLIAAKQAENSNYVPIPTDLCCPLSLEIMTDPVIVPSGQTYERAYIRKWLDLGLMVCPKTRQTLAHTNLVPNYTVKALIASWCDKNNVKLPDQPSLIENEGNSSENNHSQQHQLSSPGRTRSSVSPPTGLISSSGSSQDENSPLSSLSLSEDSLFSTVGNEPSLSNEILTLTHTEDTQLNSSEREMESDNQSPKGHIRTASASFVESSSSMPPDLVNEGSEMPSEPQDASILTTSQIRSEFPPRLETRFRSHTIGRRPTDRSIPKIVSSPLIGISDDLSRMEDHIKTLVVDLSSSSVDIQGNATAELRQLAKDNMSNRILIANSGAIVFLVNLLQSSDARIQENAVTALLNLSINDNNKIAIANAGAITHLIHVLQTGSDEAKENSAATLYSLSAVEDIKIKIGRSGAISPLVDLLANGTLRGKKDAATALFNLTLFNENKARIIQAGAVKHLIDLMDPATGMVDRAVVVLSNLSSIHEGRTAIGQEGGIPVLVDTIELGSARGRENAAAALLQLCMNSNRFCNMVLQEGVIPPLVALLRSGTPRAKEKAQSLLGHFKNQRQNNGGRD